MSERTPLSILQQDVADGVVLGGAILAGKDGKVFYDCGAGYTTPERKYAMDADTVLDVASTTKMAAVVTSLLILHARGKIDFDAPFTEYLKDFSAPLYEPVTIRDLADHHSGFGDVLGQKQRLYFDESGAKMMENMLTTPPPHPPTRHPKYACWNYLLLGMIIERITGEDLITFCRQEIFEPLDMTSTSLGSPLPGIPAERLAQTVGTPAPGVISDSYARRIYRDGLCAGNAGLFTSARDFAKLLECYLRRGTTASGKRLFGEAEMAEILPDRREHFDDYRRFGWVIRQDILPDEMFGSVLFHHGYSGQTVLFDPSRNMYGVVLTTRYGDYAGAKKRRLEMLHLLWKMIA